VSAPSFKKEGHLQFWDRRQGDAVLPADTEAP
jgi:hypothetical protein